MISRHFSRRAGDTSRRGFTLIELAVVLAILAVVAGVVAMRTSEVQAKSQLDVTRAILASARGAIVGSIERPGFFEDLGETPAQMADLFALPAALPSGKPVAPFDPYAARGWNGPYLTAPTGAFTLDPTNGFGLVYGEAGAPALVDAWGRPIVLQRPTTAGLSPALQQQYTRLVSAGPDGILDTPASMLDPDVLSASQVGDDVVAYVFRANGSTP